MTTSSTRNKVTRVLSQGTKRRSLQSPGDLCQPVGVAGLEPATSRPPAVRATVCATPRLSSLSDRGRTLHAVKRHACKYWKTFTNRRPYSRHCGFCGRWQYKLGEEWRDDMTLQRFADKWLPAISGTEIKDMLTVDVAFPFEWRCYESWKIAFRVRFEFGDLQARRDAGRDTKADIMNGWCSKYAESFAEIDFEAEQFFCESTGADYQIGDNCYPAMRAIIQR